MIDTCKKRTNTIIMITNPKIRRIRGSVKMIMKRVQTSRTLERRKRVLNLSIRTQASP
jgi:hypothetical protein